jgi:hypothetical protein
VSTSFASTIKPYFTAYFRAHMLAMGPQFDLWDITQVKNPQIWQTIYNAVSNGTMPPTSYPGVWDNITQTQFLQDFQAWKNDGYPP